MKCISALIFFTISLVLSEASALETKGWKTFNSKFGYDFKYPACWKVQIDDVDYSGPIEGSKSLILLEQPGCERPSLFESPRGVSFSAGRGSKKTKTEAVAEVEKIEQRSKKNVELQDWLVFKKFKAGPEDVLAWVEPFGENEVRWQFWFYCKDWWVWVTGPAMKKPDKAYLEKFKNGDLALPEPEKTVIETIRCISPKPN